MTFAAVRRSYSVIGAN